jgi:hypothetical protein
MYSGFIPNVDRTSLLFTALSMGKGGGSLRVPLGPSPPTHGSDLDTPPTYFHASSNAENRFSVERDEGGEEGGLRH